MLLRFEAFLVWIGHGMWLNGRAFALHVTGLSMLNFYYFYCSYFFYFAYHFCMSVNGPNLPTLKQGISI